MIDGLMGTNQYGYDYDPIGNRRASNADGNNQAYLANELNQYLSITSSLPSSSVSLAYDADGNLTNYAGWSLAWDAENRLVEIRASAPTNNDVLVQYFYDYQSRRVGRRLYKWVGDSFQWLLNKGAYFVFDAWNPIAEYSPIYMPGSVPYLSWTNRSYLGIGGKTNLLLAWGLDLSGTLQGAGGIGGLLFTHTPEFGSMACSLCDANGNSTDLVSTNGDILAHYEYDPYGNLIYSSGSQANLNHYRFSSKYTDDDSGLVYFGYRFYHPELGRWTSRDPSVFEQYMNLYLFANNDALNHADYHGLLSVDYRDVETISERPTLGGSGGADVELTINCTCSSGQEGTSLDCKLTVKPVIKINPNGAIVDLHDTIDNVPTYEHEQNHIKSFAATCVPAIKYCVGRQEWAKYCNDKECNDAKKRAEEEVEYLKEEYKEWSFQKEYGGRIRLQPFIDYGKSGGEFLNFRERGCLHGNY